MLNEHQIIVRDLFTPVQPFADRFGEGVAYQEFLPDKRLKDFIYYYWELKSQKPLTQPYDYKVVADGCVDIFFEMTNPHSSFVMGFSNTYTEFQLKDSFHYIGIRFLPAMFTNIFNIKASELSNRIEDLHNILPATSGFFSKHFQQTTSGDYLKNTLDHYFLKLTTNVDVHYDGRIREAVHIILNKSGSLHIEKELKTGISPRQLRRLFDFYIGGTPKEFSKVVRFQNMLQANSFVPPATNGKIYFDAGYHDQSHFIKEFKSFYGDTPTHALRK